MLLKIKRLRFAAGGEVNNAAQSRRVIFLPLIAKKFAERGGIGAELSRSVLRARRLEGDVDHRAETLTLEFVQLLTELGGSDRVFGAILHCRVAGVVAEVIALVADGGALAEKGQND